MQREPRFGIVYDERMPVFEPERWGYRPTKHTVVAGLIGVASLALCVSLFAAGDLLVARAPRLSLGAERREAALPTVQPPDRNRVITAYERVRTVREHDGVEGLARTGVACFAELERTPNYAQLDYCLAFDAFASAVNRAMGTKGSEADGYFADAIVRHIRALDTVGASRGEADARIAAISRLASGVARERFAAEPLYPPPPPPEPEEETTLEDTPAPALEEQPYTVLGPDAEAPPGFAPGADQPPVILDPASPPPVTPQPAPAPPAPGPRPGG